MNAVTMRRWAAGGAVCSAVVLGATACDQPGARRAAGPVAESHAEPVRVDSILPMDEEIRRFKAQVADPVTALAGGVASAEALVVRFMSALAVRDSVALTRLAITPAEFIHLYYEHTRFTAGPYQMSPHLVWFQLETAGGKGLTRALARFGGRPLGYVDHACDADTTEGPNRLRGGCVVRVRGASGTTESLSLFGPMIERGGAWKFVSYANRL